MRDLSPSRCAARRALRRDSAMAPADFLTATRRKPSAGPLAAEPDRQVDFHGPRRLVQGAIRSTARRRHRASAHSSSWRAPRYRRRPQAHERSGRPQDTRGRRAGSRPLPPVCDRAARRPLVGQLEMAEALAWQIEGAMDAPKPVVVFGRRPALGTGVASTIRISRPWLAGGAAEASACPTSVPSQSPHRRRR